MYSLTTFLHLQTLCIRALIQAKDDPDKLTEAGITTLEEASLHYLERVAKFCPEGYPIDDPLYDRYKNTEILAEIMANVSDLLVDEFSL